MVLCGLLCLLLAVARAASGGPGALLDELSSASQFDTFKAQFDSLAAVPIRARSHHHFVLPLIHFTPDSLTYSIPLFMKR
jgi:hypothetical protein